MLKHIFVISAVVGLFCEQSSAMKPSVFDFPYDVSDDEDGDWGSDNSVIEDGSILDTDLWLSQQRKKNGFSTDHAQELPQLLTNSSKSSEDVVVDSFVLVKKVSPVVSEPIKSLSKLSLAHLDDEFFDKEREPVELENHTTTPTKCFEQLLEATQHKNFPLSLQRARRLLKCAACCSNINKPLSDAYQNKTPLVAVVDELGKIENVSKRSKEKIQNIVCIVRQCGADDIQALTAVDPKGRKNRYAFNALSLDLNSYTLSE